MKKRLLLFDHDGVLVETEKWYFQANQDVLKTVGIDLEMSKYMEIMVAGQSALDVAKEKNFSFAEIEKLRCQRNDLYQNYLRTKDLEIPKVTETLEKLKPYHQMAIVTTSLYPDFLLIHQNDYITKYMDKIFTRKDYNKSKPHPEPYLTALSAFGVKPEDALVIEDSERGLRSAVAAGIDCVIVKNSFTSSHDFSKATKVIEKISDLTELLSN